MLRMAFLIVAVAGTAGCTRLGFSAAAGSEGLAPADGRGEVTRVDVAVADAGSDHSRIHDGAGDFGASDLLAQDQASATTDGRSADAATADAATADALTADVASADVFTDAGPADLSSGDALSYESIQISTTSWQTTVRGQLALSAMGHFRVGQVIGATEITDVTRWMSSEPSVVQVGDSAATKGHALAVGVGSATITATEPVSGQQAILVVTVGPAPLLVQWGGYQIGGHGIYDPSSGQLSQTLWMDPANQALDYRGLLALPGGFLYVGTNPYLATDFASYRNNDGSMSANPLVLSGWTADGGIQNLTLTRDGAYLLAPQYYANSIFLFDAKTGAFLSSFGAGEVSAPFRAVELDDESVVVSSFGDGRLVRFARIQGGYGSGATFAAGFFEPMGLDYCPAKQSLLLSQRGPGAVYRCDPLGTCSVFNNHGLVDPRMLKIDLNSKDCAFFLSWANVTQNEIARFNGDGTLDQQHFALMPAGVARVFAIDFLIPPALPLPPF